MITTRITEEMRQCVCGHVSMQSNSGLIKNAAFQTAAMHRLGLKPRH
uniref:Uncharacterized protein n=1 Tax=Anguilla anguilla TaxID=7936 RepID=A0A0E9VUH5_ANGAN